MISEAMTSSLDERLKRFDNRPGFDLVSHQLVALPVYKLLADALILIQKPIPPIEEYALKAINLGFTDEVSLSGVLGLELPTIRDSLSSLRVSTFIDLTPESNSRKQVWQLTKKGTAALTQLVCALPDERSLEIHFDGLTRKVFLQPNPEFMLIDHKKARQEGRVEIEPSEKSPPNISDITISEVDKIIQRIDPSNTNASRSNRKLLALKDITRRRRLYQRAEALVYRSRETREIQVSFLIEGRLSSEHEDAFSKTSNIKKLRIAESLLETDSTYAAAQLLDPELLRTINSPELTNLEKQFVERQQAVKTVHKQIATSTDADEKKRLLEQLAVAEVERDQLAQNLQNLKESNPVHMLKMYEHRPMLMKLLKECKNRLMIISPWLSDDVVDQEVCYNLEKLLAKGINVYIGFGININLNRDKSSQVKAEEQLRQLAKRFTSCFHLKRIGNTHSKILICDDQIAIIGSFNWLSFRGDVSRTFRDETSLAVTWPHLVNNLFAENQKQYFQVE